MAKSGRYVFGDCRGGRNGYDPPWAIADNECVDAVNVDWYQSRVARKRGGMSSVSLTGATVTVGVRQLLRHVPTTSDADAELWMVDRNATPVINRLAGGTVWTVPTIKDALTGVGIDVYGASINGKFVLAYPSAQARTHCWDTSTIRRMGIAKASAAPTAANTGGGAYAAVLRYYRVRFIEQSGGVTVRRSEPSASVSFTPSGAGTAARVTRPTAPSEGETHWELEGSSDNVTFYVIFGDATGAFSPVVIGTTTADDGSAYPLPGASGYTASALTGTYTLWPSVKFVAAAENRLLGFGSFTSTEKQNRIWYSAVIGSLNIGDLERLDTTSKYYDDFDEHDSGTPTGLIGPVWGNFYAFKRTQVWEGTPTGEVARPFRWRAISKTVGALDQAGICIGEDADGNPAIYFMSARGPYCYGVHGLTYIGRGIEDLILGPTSTLYAFRDSIRITMCVYLPDKRQLWLWFATGNTFINNLAIKDVTVPDGGGWSRVPTTDTLANCVSAVMFANTLGAIMSADLKPYVGNGLILYKADTGTDDAGTTFKAYVVTKAVEPGGAGFFGEVGEAELLAQAASGVTITATVTADYGLQTATGTALLTASASETRVTKRLEASALAGDVSFIQHQIGDASAVSNTWNLDRILVPYSSKDPRTV